MDELWLSLMLIEIECSDIYISFGNYTQKVIHLLLRLSLEILLEWWLTRGTTLEYRVPLHHPFNNFFHHFVHHYLYGEKVLIKRTYYIIFYFLQLIFDILFNNVSISKRIDFTLYTKTFVTSLW